MTGFLRTLAEGDLRSDGFANEVARIVAEQPALLPDLMDALASSDSAVRAHAADALEKVARTRPREVEAFLSRIVDMAIHDQVAMVRWHLAMVLGYLSSVTREKSRVGGALLKLLKDESPFVRSWAITSLCILAKESPGRARSTAKAIADLAADPSAAVAKRAQTGLRVLARAETPLPKSWVKSTYRRDLTSWPG